LKYFTSEIKNDPELKCSATTDQKVVYIRSVCAGATVCRKVIYLITFKSTILNGRKTNSGPKYF